jgi:hypothetical protein
MLDVNWNPSRRELRQFAGLCLVFGAAVGGLILYRGGSWSVALTIWAVAAMVAALGLASPTLMRPIYMGWMAAAYPIGWTVSHFVLAVTFYLVVTPIGLLLRLAGREPLGRRPHGSAGSYWIRHEPPRDAASYFKQF